MEAKTTRCHSIQAAEVACSKAISDAEAQKTSQAVMFQEEHSKYMQSLEEQAFGEESRSHHEFLSSCHATLCHSPQLLRGVWLPHIIFYWYKHLHPLHPFCHQGLPLQKNSHPQPFLPFQCPNSLQDSKGDILHQS